MYFAGMIFARLRAIKPQAADEIKTGTFLISKLVQI